ncbi:MAG TPA: hypothetical protein VFV38_44620 [Ktedonobacteraceae bacterium]|nr:hypothetical protein [Ktedonobacteraceae bacterium]
MTNLATRSHRILTLLLTCLLLLGAVVSFSGADAHAATATSDRAMGQTQVFWVEDTACGLAQVSIYDIVDVGHWYCFYLTEPGWGYLGLGDFGGPGNISQAFKLNDIAAGPGWIRYYGGSYPGGTFCRFGNGQHINLPYVYVTQIALNVSSSYHQCP